MIRLGPVRQLVMHTRALGAGPLLTNRQATVGKLEVRPVSVLPHPWKVTSTPGRTLQLFDLLISSLITQNESTGQPDLARDAHMIQRQSGFVLPKTTLSEAGIIHEQMHNSLPQVGMFS